MQTDRPPHSSASQGTRYPRCQVSKKSSEVLIPRLPLAAQRAGKDRYVLDLPPECRALHASGWQSTPARRTASRGKINAEENAMEIACEIGERGSCRSLSEDFPARERPEIDGMVFDPSR
jgi:hypothetical protein